MHWRRIRCFMCSNCWCLCCFVRTMFELLTCFMCWNCRITMIWFAFTVAINLTDSGHKSHLQFIDSFKWSSFAIKFNAADLHRYIRIVKNHSISFSILFILFFVKWVLFTRSMHWLIENTLNRFFLHFLYIFSSSFFILSSHPSNVKMISRDWKDDILRINLKIVIFLLCTKWLLIAII